MRWNDFKQMPVSVQSEYITNLQNLFGVTAVDLGNMFGVRGLTVRKHADANGLDVSFPRGRMMNEICKEEWLRFLGEKSDEVNVMAPASLPERTGVTDDGGANSSSRAEGHKDSVDMVMPLTHNSMCMKRFSLQFAGVIDVHTIANSLRLILGDQSEGELEIICNLA